MQSWVQSSVAQIQFCESNQALLLHIIKPSFNMHDCESLTVADKEFRERKVVETDKSAPGGNTNVL